MGVQITRKKLSGIVPQMVRLPVKSSVTIDKSKFLGKMLGLVDFTGFIAFLLVVIFYSFCSKN